MDNSKYKILVIPSDRTGVSKFRSVDPHIRLQELYPEDFWVDVDYEPKLDDESYLTGYDLIHFHRHLSPNHEVSLKALKKIKKLGIPAIMDIDDYWLPTIDHPAHAIVKQHQLDKNIKAHLKETEYISTTTQIYANEMKTFGGEIFILPNAVNPNERQFQPKPVDSDVVRIGWLGGSSHLKDLEILSGMPGRLSTSCTGKFQFVLCGYDLRGKITEMNQQTGQQTTRDIEPHESIWYTYEKIFTENYKIVSKEYGDWLQSFKKGKYKGEEELPYRRVWTKPITTYASNYNLFDVSLAPIKEHVFNYVKSQLKVIEAGFHKKALIAQDYGPYQIDCVNAVEYGGKLNSKGNCLMVETRKNHKQWYQHIKRLIDNPNMVKDLGEKLYEDVQKYHMDNVCKTRAQIYKELIKKA